jgi:hypothetical protein
VPRLPPTSESGLRLADGDALQASHTASPGAPRPDLEEGGTGSSPRYGLLVTIVALISIAVPVTVYAVLRRGGHTVAVAAPSEPVLDVQTHDDPPRAKAIRGKNGLLTAASATPSGSAAAPVMAATTGSVAPVATGAPAKR